MLKYNSNFNATLILENENFLLLVLNSSDSWELINIVVLAASRHQVFFPNFFVGFCTSVFLSQSIMFIIIIFLFQFVKLFQVNYLGRQTLNKSFSTIPRGDEPVLKILCEIQDSAFAFIYFSIFFIFLFDCYYEFKIEINSIFWVTILKQIIEILFYSSCS